MATSENILSTIGPKLDQCERIGFYRVRDGRWFGSVTFLSEIYMGSGQTALDVARRPASGGPPQRACYCPWKPEDATWLQVWETVSEGTPVTPPFATRQELVDYLVQHGDLSEIVKVKR